MRPCPVPPGTEGGCGARYHNPAQTLNLLSRPCDTNSNRLNPLETPVTQHTTSQTLQMVNFTVGFALLVMLFPVAGKAVEKPAGVRTAIEMVSKKITLKAIR